MRVLSWIACALLLTTEVTAADSWAPPKKLETWFDELGATQRFSGSVAVAAKGRLRYQRSVGFARVGRIADPADEGTRYRIGTLTRLFTAVLTMQQVEKATITLDTPVAEFYADVPNALLITYRDLLQDRSGLADYFDMPDFATWRLQPRTHQQVLAAVSAAGARFEPRARIEPSNGNYLLLGYVLEKVQGRPYDEILRRSIATLGLARTYFAAAEGSTLESVAYRAAPAGWESLPASDPTVLGGAAGVISNAGDLAQYMDALFAGKLVSEQSLATLRGSEDAPGMVLQARKFAGEAAVGFTGGGDGFTAAVYHFPARQLSIAVTTNYSTVPPDELIEQVLATGLHRGHKPRLAD
jgi:CubicO group peptidase (beta-lactamase class C family)